MPCNGSSSTYPSVMIGGFFCEAIGTAATPGLLCQPRVIVKMIVEKQMECRLTGKTEVLGEYLP
jgi:RNA 3'-terminal phosphate cyclase